MRKLAFLARSNLAGMLPHLGVNALFFFSGFFITPIIVIFGENTDPCVIPADRKKLARIEPQAR